MSINTESVCPLAHAASVSAKGRGMVLGSQSQTFFYVSSKSSAGLIVDEIRLRDLLSDPERRALVKEIYACEPPLDCEDSVEMTRVRRLFKFVASICEYQITWVSSRGWRTVYEKPSSMHLTRTVMLYDNHLIND